MRFEPCEVCGEPILYVKRYGWICSNPECPDNDDMAD